MTSPRDASDAGSRRQGQLALTSKSKRRRRSQSKSASSLPASLLLLLLLLMAVTIISAQENTTTPTPIKTHYKFALVPKSVDNPFFDASRDGCVDRAKAISQKGYSLVQNGSTTHQNITVKCHYLGPDALEKTGEAQAALVQELIDRQTYDGISISVRSADYMRPVISAAVAQGIPVVTFDADDSESQRASYIGTDNEFFGRQLGKVLQQIHPEVGTYAIVTDTPQNVQLREKGLRATLDGVGWKEVEESPQHEEGNGVLAIEKMRYLATTYPNITAIVPVMGAPMFEEALFMELVEDFRNVLFVVADGLPVQLSLLSRNYGHGLVAQMPYAMGTISVDSLLQLAVDPTTILPEFQGTNVLEHLQIPLVLPELIVDQNHLGKLSIVGFTLFGVVFLTATGFITWTWRHRNLSVVRLAQPEFLIMIACGASIMGSAMVPLSFDDGHTHFSDASGIAMCMSVPWLGFTGFTIMFSAMLAKQWRINQIFLSSGQFTRVEVTGKQMATPFCILLLANTAVLICWTVIDPMMYVRIDMPGTDGWNRVLATYGTCESEGSSTPYLAVLGAINLLVLAKANYQSYIARKIKSSFSESRYIAITMASMMQACLIGVPLLFLVRDMPQAYYLTMVFMLFTVSQIILLLIFVPKIVNARNFTSRSKKSQRRIVQDAIHETSQHGQAAAAGSAVFVGKSSHTKNGSVRNRHKRKSTATDEDMQNTSVAEFRRAAQQSTAVVDSDADSDVETGQPRMTQNSSNGSAASSQSFDYDDISKDFDDDKATVNASQTSSWRQSMELAKLLEQTQGLGADESKKLWDASKLSDDRKKIIESTVGPFGSQRSSVSTYAPSTDEGPAMDTYENIELNTYVANPKTDVPPPSPEKAPAVALKEVETMPSPSGSPQRTTSGRRVSFVDQAADAAIVQVNHDPNMSR